MNTTYKTLLANDWSAILLCAPYNRRFAIDLWLDHCEEYLTHFAAPAMSVPRAGGAQWDNRRRAKA